MIPKRSQREKTMMRDVMGAFEQFKLAGPILFALVDEARQKLIVQLSGAGQTGMNVSDLASDSGLSRPAISHHLKVLKDAGLVSTRKSGTQVFYRLDLSEKTARLEGMIKALTILLEQARKFEEGEGAGAS